MGLKQEYIEEKIRGLSPEETLETLSRIFSVPTDSIYADIRMDDWDSKELLSLLSFKRELKNQRKVKKRAEVTWNDIFRDFLKMTNTPEVAVVDWRPTSPTYGVPKIDMAIVVWLRNTESHLIYIYKGDN